MSAQASSGDRADGEPKSTGARRGERLHKLSVLAEEAVQAEVNSSDEDADDAHDQQHFLVPDFLRLTGGYRNAWREHGRERFVIQLSIVHRHFAGVIELGFVHDDLRVQFCSQSRSGMKHGRLVDSAIVRCPNADRHRVGTGVLAAVELDLGFEPRAH